MPTCSAVVSHAGPTCRAASGLLRVVPTGVLRLIRPAGGLRVVWRAARRLRRVGLRRSTWSAGSSGGIVVRSVDSAQLRRRQVEAAAHHHPARLLWDETAAVLLCQGHKLEGGRELSQVQRRRASRGGLPDLRLGVCEDDAGGEAVAKGSVDRQGGHLQRCMTVACTTRAEHLDSHRSGHQAQSKVNTVLKCAPGPGSRGRGPTW